MVMKMTTTKFSLLLLLFSLSLSSFAGLVSPSIWHHEEPNATLHRIVFDERNKRIVVAGTNSILMFDQLLQRLQTFQTGPATCLPLEDGRKCDGETNDDDEPRVLLLSRDGRHLVYCGSVHDDMCTVHDSWNLNFYREIRSDRPPFLGRGRSSVAVLHGDWSLFVGRPYDERNGHQSYAVSRFVLEEEEDGGGRSRERLFSGGLSFDESLRAEYLVDYADAFEHEGFVYFLTVQRETEAEDAYHSKLVRICAGDDRFDSYSELELSCTRRDPITQTHDSFNVARTSHLSRMGPGLVRRHSVDPEAEVLYVVMGRGRPQALEGEETAVCAYPMAEVRREFVKLQRDCYAGIGMILPWIDGRRPRCKMDKDVAKTIDNKFCGHPLNVGIGSRYPLHSSPLYLGHSDPITAIRVVVINNRTVSILGTERGILLKVVLDDPNPIPYFSVNLNPGMKTSPVSSSMAMDSAERNLFALVGNRVSKISLRTCDDYADCMACIGVDDPNNCGWCNDHCSTSDQCEGATWQNNSCSPTIYSFSPKKGPSYGNTLVQIHGDNFGHDMPNVKATVGIGDASCSIKFRNNTFIICKTSPYLANYERELNVSITDDLRAVLPYNIEGYDITEGEYFSFMQPSVTSIYPSLGPNSGGTEVTLTGRNLNIGSLLVVSIGGSCTISDVSAEKIVCTTSALNPQPPSNDSLVHVHVFIDGTDISSLNFRFLKDPVVFQVVPRQSIFSGGQMLTVHGTGLNIVEKPRLCVKISETNHCSAVCHVNKTNEEKITCPSPAILSTLNVLDAIVDDLDINGEMHFIMDGVEEVWKRKRSGFSSPHRILRYFPDPRFEPVNKDSFVDGNVLKMEGAHLNWSARAEDYLISVDDCLCNVTELTNNVLLCRLPKRFVISNNFVVTVKLGSYTCESKSTRSKSDHLSGPMSAYPHLFWIFLAAIVIVLLFTATIYTAWMRGLTRSKKEEKRSRTMPNVFYEQTPHRRAPQMEIFNVEEGYNFVSGANNNNNNNGDNDNHRVQQRNHVLPSNQNPHRGTQRHLSNTYWPQTSNGDRSRQAPPLTVVDVSLIMDERTRQLLDDLNLIIPRRRITVLESIGQGHFGCVYRAVLEDEQKSSISEVAVKTLKNPLGPDAAFHLSDCKKFIEEAMTMQEFNHDHVLSLIGIVIDRGDESPTNGLRSHGVLGLPMVVLPFMKHGDLLSYIRNEKNMPTVKNLMNFGIQIGKGMSYLSCLKFVHRDLAARNCMLDDDMMVKVADFGLSRDVYEREYYSSEDRKAALPIKWMAIESLEKGIYSTKSDVWSFGIVLWELLTRGVSPYMEVDSWDVLKFLKQGRRLVQPAYCPPALYRLMKKCWYSDPSLRPTFDELVTSIEVIIEKMEKRGTEVKVTHEYDNVTSSEGPAHGDSQTNQDISPSDDEENKDDEDGYLRPLDNIDCSSLSTEHLQLVADSR